ncbi:cysteine hydrolase family protein [Acetobacterium bakii]|uniref:Isochorismatase n=1 Tax=Acetobacterium bakii TaxID=52689 RepID=A0A0L6TX47_9FIRM|nr:isochorismatase family cysteine hydrolase [Acetobacterium bakii]KNZ40828.1 isochorismatase [Acetobacterium bakii]
MKSILLVIDYQKDFVDGALGFQQAAVLEAAIARKIGAYRKRGDEVAFTFDTHKEDYLTTREGSNLPIPHCIKGTEGWDLYGKIADLCLETDKRFEKVTFGSMELADYLRMNQYDRIELVGVVSNICVLSNAVLAKAALPEADIVVDASGVASNDDRLNRAALDVMESLHIKITNR